MTIFDEISIIANKLANQGKSPSVALIKARLSQPVPLPKIIEVLKNWQHDPKFVASKNEKPAETTEKVTNQATEEISQEVAKALVPIQNELKEIKALLQQLTNNK